MPVSLYGLSCDLDPIIKIAKENKIGVINDAAEAYGSLYKGKKISEIADITSYSTENSKHITTGDGGIVVTDNEHYAIKMRKFGSLGYSSMTSGDGRIRINKDKFQDPSYSRHDDVGLNYRMPEVAAALGLAQTERLEHFIDLRIGIANLFSQAIEGCDYLVPQLTPKGYLNSYWTYTLKYTKEDVSWKDFRKRYVDFGGDGIYAAWKLTYQEDLMALKAYKRLAPHYYENLEYPDGICPVAEKIQPQLMQFVTNYGSLEEAKPQVDALVKTIDYFS
jgi:perosamine synthetase